MTRIMLIDATHAEEKRVAIISNSKLEEFDYETSTKQQFKGNIYLAKVIRVEPSLQAAFVEYGGNRHGFLAFSEIHPDYYRIPVADQSQASPETPENTASDTSMGEGDLPVDLDGEEISATEVLEVVGGAQEDDDRSHHQVHKSPRGYKIQDVIKRRQIMLVQVVKEERNAKGAALTTYLSLAGRYCVLMPNAEREGGVSRKITNVTDRKRLKSMIDDLEIPDSMGVIIRTAGMERSKLEIRRDFEYLVRLWNEIREKTLESTAPSLIHQEGDLIKRSIRDLYTGDIEEIWVEGQEGYKAAKHFMKTLMPSHAKKIHLYEDQALSLFHQHKVEVMLDAIHSPTVQLRSGGYIVINPTEALVAIDINSGRATRERHIEETAFKTNLEAADEIALQLRLRDLAGLIVIDFIDMEDNKNIHTVERRLKEAMAEDRARIQIGRISPFGLLELSRQRLRPSIIEVSTMVCPHCEGLGHVRSAESSALHVLRALEEEAQHVRDLTFNLKVPTPVAFYLLNHKRAAITKLEGNYNIKMIIEADDTLLAPNFTLDYLGRQELVKKIKKEQSAQEHEARKANRRRPDRPNHKNTGRVAIQHDDVSEGEPIEQIVVQSSSQEDGSIGGQETTENNERRRRRRRRRRGPREGAEGVAVLGQQLASDGPIVSTVPEKPMNLDTNTGLDKADESSRTRNRRPLRQRPVSPNVTHEDLPSVAATEPSIESDVSVQKDPAVKRVRRIKIKDSSEGQNSVPPMPEQPQRAIVESSPALKKPRVSRAKKTEVPVSEKIETPQAQEAEQPVRKGARSGWWKRLLENE